MSAFPAQRLALWLGFALIGVGTSFAAIDATTRVSAVAYLVGLALIAACSATERSDDVGPARGALERSDDGVSGAAVGEPPARGLWHRVLVYFGLANGRELIAHWNASRPDTLVRSVGSVVAMAVIVTLVIGAVLAVRVIV